MLIIASTDGSPDMVKALLAAGAEVDAVHPWAGTALAAAAAENRADTVTILLESGANANLRLPADLGNEKRAGKTALEVARAAKAKKVIPLLEASTAR